MDLGVEGARRVKGVSFYECEAAASTGESAGESALRVTYVRDIPEPLMKPLPVQALAGVFDPALRVFYPAPYETDAVSAARR